MIDDLKAFIVAGLNAAGAFNDIVTTTDERFADKDAKPPVATYAVKVDRIRNVDQVGNEVQLIVTILILLTDWDQQRATDKMINLHTYITGQEVTFTDPDKFWQEDLFRLPEGSPEILVNSPVEFSLGIEYTGTVSVDTTL